MGTATLMQQCNWTHAGRSVTSAEEKRPPAAIELPEITAELFLLDIQTEMLRRRFSQLAERWRQERGSTSSMTDIVNHPAYRKLIDELGRAAIRFILEELGRRPDYWFSALRELTGENPVSQEQRGNLQQMTQAWLSWGRNQGYKV